MVRNPLKKILDPDRDPNLITCSFYHPEPLHKISSQSVHKFLSNVANRQTDKQTKQTNATENITVCFKLFRPLLQIKNDNLITWVTPFVKNEGLMTEFQVFTVWYGIE